MSVLFDEVVVQALQLSPAEKLKLVERLAADLEKDFAAQAPVPRPSLYGALADLGAAPSAEDIDDARREAWANFPREDI